MITLADYWMGRHQQYALQCSPDIERNALLTVNLANALLVQAQTYGVVLHQLSPTTRTLVSSGWRPPAINCATPNAAPNSKHMTGQAIDLYDPDGLLDDWLMTGEGQAALTAIGLWMEHPAATKGWCHIQSIPPASHRRVFYP